MFKKITVNGVDAHIEREHLGESYSVQVGREFTVGFSESEVINRLRAKGFEVAVESANDDGLIAVWHVFATNPTHPSGEDAWHYLTEKDALKGTEYLKGKHPNLVKWRLEPTRMTQENFRILNNGEFTR